MSEADAINILRGGILVTIKLSAPILVISMIVGLIISILQTTTSIQEQTLTFVPKLLAIVVTLLVFASWFVQEIMDYTREIFSLIEKI